VLQILTDLLTSPVVLTMLGAAGIAVIDAVAAALADTHPLIAKALLALADMIRSRTGRKPPLSLPLLALLALGLFAADASAFGRRCRSAGSCGSCCQSSYSYSYAPPCGSCCSPSPSFAPSSFGSCKCAGGGCGCVGTQYYVCPTSHGWPCDYCPGGSCQPVYQNPLYVAPAGCPTCPGGSCGAPPVTIWQSGPGVLGTQPWRSGPITLPPAFGGCPGGVCPAPGR
jgi:hypothetical protein